MRRLLHASRGTDREPRGDNGYADFPGHALVHQCAEDDVRIRVHRFVDHFGGGVNLADGWSRKQEQEQEQEVRVKPLKWTNIGHILGLFENNQDFTDRV